MTPRVMTRRFTTRWSRSRWSRWTRSTTRTTTHHDDTETVSHVRRNDSDHHPSHGTHRAMTHATDPGRTRARLDSTRLNSRRLARRSMRCDAIDRSMTHHPRFFRPVRCRGINGWMLTRSVIRITRVLGADVESGRRRSKKNTDAIRARDSGSGSERGGIGESRSRARRVGEIWAISRGFD